jgi:NodT family efflux transporter outer membrane factor (OMF) lipoprotein
MSLRSCLELMATVLAGAALAACAVGPNYKRPAVATPARYKNSVAAPPSRSAQPPAQWWTLFHDSTLDRLIEQVDVSNQNLAQALAAYQVAAATVSEARAAFFPMVSLTASGTRLGSGGRSNTFATVGSVGVGTSGGGANSLFEVSGSASWEIDVWGRLRRALESAKASARASLADLASARLSAQAQLATAYLELREADAADRLLAATVQAYGRTLQITRNRYAVGSAPKTDVLQAETQLYDAQQQLAATGLQRAQLEDAIAALIGKPASDFKLAPVRDWNIPAPTVPPGIPSTLLERRPDIVAAEAQVAASNAEIGVNEAAYFPSLTLTGTESFLSSALSSLFNSSSESHQGALSIGQTIFDFGATRAKVAAARATYLEAVASYRQTVLAAFQSVENDLAATDWDEKQYRLLEQASAAADETERLTLNEYKAGTVDYTTVVVAQAAALSARLSLAQMTLARQTAAVTLVTDLGGGWQPVHS